MSLGMQVFLSILGVSLGTTAIVGLFARTALSSAFDRYLASLPSTNMQGRPRMGRMMLGSAEKTFVASVDSSVLLAAGVATVIAVAVAVVLAAYLTRPLRRLETAAEELAAGDLAHRVDANGPLEVATLGDAFNRMADSLERAEELRRRMVADVAHELRNPLAAARAQAEGMADGILVADEARLCSVVEDLTHLSALIDDLQELAVAEAGRMRYDMAQVDLCAVVRNEARSAQALLRDGVELLIADGPSAALVTGDERRLAQVLRNLMSNAARHTLHGSVTVAVSQPDATTVEVRVIDTGEGIAAAELPHIFERFYRADAARAATTGGTGLGLAISRTIVTDHGGEVFASSEVDKGTTIGFRLPSRG